MPLNETETLDPSETDFKEFKESTYLSLVELAKSKFKFVSYSEANPSQQTPFILWRHDVDFSVHRSLALAKLEASQNVKATYFLYLHSPFYNLLELEVAEICREVLSLGHYLGLHFDFEFYKNQLEDDSKFHSKIQFEKDLLENILGHPVSSISFHNPAAETLNSVNQPNLLGMRNAYSQDLIEGCDYVSDSNGYYRFRSIESALNSPRKKHLQVVTHPAWWGPETMSPRDRISKCIDGRAAAVHRWYDKSIASFSRKNVR